MQTTTYGSVTSTSSKSSSSSSSSSHSTITSSSSTSSATIPPPKTVTSACQVCVLPYGSLDPACNPIPGCVLTTSTPTTSSAATTTSSTYPGCGTVSVAGFTCDNNCRGFVACPPWCVANCASCFNENNVC
jgi:hypothetical protein